MDIYKYQYSSLNLSLFKLLRRWPETFSGCFRNETWQKNVVLADMIETSETHICTKIWTSPCNRVIRVIVAREISMRQALYPADRDKR